MAWKNTPNETEETKPVATGSTEAAAEATETGADIPQDDVHGLDIDNPDDVMQIIENCIGLGEDGKPRSICVVAVEGYEPQVKEVKTKKTVRVLKGILSVMVYQSVIRLDLEFDREAAPEYRQVKLLAKRVSADISDGERENMKEEDLEFLRLVATPTAYKGRFILSAFNPMFCIPHAEDEITHVNKVTFVFRPENVGVYDSGEEVDMRALEAEADRMLDAQERTAEYFAEKQVEKDKEAREKEEDNAGEGESR